MPFGAILALVPELFKAITATMRVLPLFMIFKLRNGVRDYEDEIIKLSINADPSARLRIEQLEQRRQEDVKLLGSIRSACNYVD